MNVCFLFIFVVFRLTSCFAKRVELDWSVEYVYGARDGSNYRRSIGVNGATPIPAVHVMQGDTLVLNVHNKLDVATSLHSHGIYNNGTNYFDGPSMVTECGIPPGESFTYEINTAAQSGTFWIHGHTRHADVDGLRTPFIIHSNKTPVDYDEELVITLEDWYSLEFLVRMEYVDNVKGQERPPVNYATGLLNGYDANRTAPIKFCPGKRYRLRVISMAANNWSVFRISGHKMTVIEADGVRLMPLEVDGLNLGPGQRNSVIVTALNSTDFNYVFEFISTASSVDNLEDLKPRYYSGIVEYREDATIKDFSKQNDKEPVWPDDMALQAADKQPWLPVDRSIELTVNRFIDKFGVPYWSLGKTLYQPTIVPTLYTAMSMGNLASNESVYAPQTNAYVLRHLEVIEFVISNPFINDHTFHMHGHDFQVTEAGPCGKATGGYPEVSYRKSGPWPIRRDTVQVRAFEYVRLRLRADNPGVWRFHCHIAPGHDYNGLAVILVEAPELLQKQQQIPSKMIEMCKMQGIPTAGNAAEQDIIEQSGTIRNILSDIGSSDTPIPVPNVSGPILTKVIDYCRHHRNDPSRRQPREPVYDETDSSETAIQRAISQMDDFDEEFCRVDQGTLFDLILAANFLDIQPLIDLVGFTVANKMKGKTVEEMRATFNVKNDFTPEEEERVRQENAWCEE
ncbi:ferroxidase fet3 [Coemansia sp. RSA 2702]|nr:ferroxidase fet3 [Coemansia sp. RSA 2702]